MAEAVEATQERQREEAEELWSWLRNEGLKGGLAAFGPSEILAAADALGNNTTGSFNTAVGIDALKGNTFAASNTAVGAKALENSTGNANTAVGINALINRLPP